MRIRDLFRPAHPRNRYLWLLVWLVAYVLAGAVVTTVGVTKWGIDLLFAGVLFATLRALSRRPAEFRIAAVTGALVLVASAVAAVTSLPAAVAAKAFCGALFSGFLSAVVLREVLQGETVDADTIRGAICAYLFVGVSWAGTYGFVENLRPGSLATPGAGGIPIGHRPEMYIYFSFVTLATLGYGDIVPATALTRALAWLEAVFGQFYIAVLVARLVSMQRHPAGGGGR
jgi:ion channel